MLSNDKEILECAAKAMGLSLVWVSYCPVPGSNTYPHVKTNDGIRYWNPLDQDASAFQIAAQLLFSVSFDCGFTRVTDQQERCTTIRGATPAYGRRAITVAAAEIGRAMQ